MFFLLLLDLFLYLAYSHSRLVTYYNPLLFKVVAQLEKVKLTLEKETGKAVSLNCWAEAAGIDEKVLQHDLHFGWYCRDELLKSGRSLVLYLSRYYRGLGVAHEDLMQVLFLSNLCCLLDG